MLGEAPGTARLSDWVGRYDAGASLEDLANHVAGSSAFRAMYPNFDTNRDFAEKFLGNLMGDEDVPPALMAAAVDIVTGLLNDGMTRGALALNVVAALQDINVQGAAHPAHGDLGGVAARLANQIEVAEYYTLDAGMADPSSDALAGVSSDPATVAEAKHDIDSPPADAVFDAVGDLSINENLASGEVGMVTATDANGDAVSYSLKDAPDGFSIDAATGMISYAGAGLDHETMATVDLTVVATSTGANKMSTDVETTVTVMVADVSENAAVFGDVGELTLVEHADGSSNAISVGSVTASDPEGDPITYSIEGDPADWSIDSNGALSYTGAGVDYETNASVDLTIVATSLGGDGTQESVTQDVTVMITNQHDLEFGDHQLVSLNELTSGATTAVSLGNVVATDADEGDAVSFSLDGLAVGADGVLFPGFAIDAVSGEITYSGQGIRHSTTGSVDLKVVASSTGDDGTATSRETTITIDIQARADAMFADVGDLALDENADGSGDGNAISVGSVTASDANGDSVAYSIKDNPADWAILEDGMLVYVGTGVDYETSSSVELTIVARSTGANNLPTEVEQMVTVDINNLNDNAPVFADAGSFSLPEGADGSTTPVAAGSVSATDADGDEVSYSVKDNPAGWSIDADGALSYTGTGLDFADGAVDLTIVATSTGADGESHTAEQDITVEVEDRNNAVFADDLGTFSIDENASGVDVGGPITATDADGDEVTLSIKGDPSDWMISDAGQLRYTGSGLDYEAATSVDLTIVATSLGVNGAPTGVEEEITVAVNNLEETGNTYNLTKGEDRFTGTSNSDTFRAASGTLTPLDYIDGGDGVMDKIDISFIDANVAISPRLITVKNVEILDVATTGNFGSGSGGDQLDFSSWGLKEINMGIIGDGDSDDTDGPGTVGINAGGAAVTGSNLIGQVDIEDAGTVGLMKVAAGDTGVAVNITSPGKKTTSASVDGGTTVSINSEILAEAMVSGASGAISITSKAIADLELSNLTADGQGVTVTNAEAAADAPKELDITVNNTKATITLSGDGSAKTVNIESTGGGGKPDNSSAVTLTSASTAVTVSGAGDLTLGAPNSVKGVTAANEGKLTMAAVPTAIEKFDGSGASGAITLGTGDSPIGQEAVPES